MNVNGRGGRIRTAGPLLPKQMRYQAALHPDKARSNNSNGRTLGNAFDRPAQHSSVMIRLSASRSKAAVLNAITGAKPEPLDSSRNNLKNGLHAKPGRNHLRRQWCRSFGNM